MISNRILDGNRAVTWFTDDKMRANPEKFRLMMISRDDDCSRSLILNYNTVIVSSVIINSKLNFSLQVSSNETAIKLHVSWMLYLPR